MPTVRPYRASDWPRFITLETETGVDSLRDASDEFRATFRERWPEQLKTMYRWADHGPTTPGSLILVLETDAGEYAGHIWLTDYEDFFSAQPKLFITTIALEEVHRGKGWGTILMQRAELEARARGLSTIGLGVDASNHGAVKLYERLGYGVTRMSMERNLGK